MPKNNNYQDQNNLYSENQDFVRKNKNTYRPLITNSQSLQPSPDQENGENQDYEQEDYYRPISPQNDYQQRENFEYQNPFDVKVNPQQTQRAFNKDIGNYQKPKKGLIGFLTQRWWLVLLVIMAVSISSLALWQLLKPDAFRPGPFPNVQAKIQAPTEAPSGTPEIWKIEIVNDENVDLLDVELNLIFDSQFRYNRAITPEPSDPKGDAYFFERIDAADKEGGTSSVIVEFEGIVTGRIDEQTFMSGTLSYTPEPLTTFTNNREQVELEQATTSIAQPLVTGSINPDSSEVEANTEVRIKVLFENLSDKEISDLRLEMTYPEREHFEYLSSELILSNASSPRTEPSDGNNIWDIETLPKSGQQELIIVGKMKGAENTKHPFDLNIKIKRADDTYQSVFTASRDITIVSRPLAISTLIRGKDGQRSFAPGETLDFQINYKNQGSDILNNVQLTASINDPAEVLDFSTLKYKNDVLGNESNKNITWGGQSARFLNNMSPGLEGTIEFSIKVKKVDDMINPTLSQGSYTLIPKVEATADNIKPIIGQGEIYRARGGLGFNEVIAYRPHPTDSNKRVYTIRWELTTAQNQINNLNVSTLSSLPSTSWQPDSISPESLKNKISYNPTNGQITFNLDQLESLLGRTKSTFVVEFDLEVAKQTGSGFNNIQLHKDVTITGTDDFTGETYNIKGSQQEANID